MSRFWLSYVDHSGRLLGGLIMDSPSVLQVRARARLEGAEIGARYCEGYELDRESANLIPSDVIGRMLNPEEVHRLIRELETRTIPKKPATPSMSRRGSVARRRRVLH